jgi:hypothetical protein
MAAPIAPKALAGGATAAVSGAVLWALSTYVFKGNVPDGVASMIYVFMPGLLAFAAAWLAPHQVRPGDAAPAVAAVQPQAAADERKVPPAL